MEASKLVDMYGLLPGNSLSQSDAVQAYLQALFSVSGGNTETWVRLPRNMMPQHWRSKYRDPVVPLKLALYGHPDSGGLWERHCTKALLEIGFVEIDGWPSLFYHPKRKTALLVYVDDFKMGGPKKQCEWLWSEIRKKLDLEEPHPLDRCLGCHHNESTAKIEDGSVVRVLSYDMREFVKACVDRYIEVAGGNTGALRVVATPFLSEPDPDPKGEEADGRLGDVAASVLMKILYAARMARFDLLKAIQALACRIHRWTKWCDKALFRLV